MQNSISGKFRRAGCSLLAVQLARVAECQLAARGTTERLKYRSNARARIRHVSESHAAALQHAALVCSLWTQPGRPRCGSLGLRLYRRDMPSMLAGQIIQRQLPCFTSKIIFVRLLCQNLLPGSGSCAAAPQFCTSVQC